MSLLSRFMKLTGLINMNKLAKYSFFDLLKAKLNIRKKFDFEVVNSSLDRKTFYKRVRHYYETKQKQIDAGFCGGWNHYDIDPNESGICETLTHIEKMFWSDIKDHKLPLFPQFPIGKHFVDFANPEHRIAVECDGHEFHKDKEKDARRDADLADMGWRVVRIEGWKCKLEPYDPSGKPLWEKLSEIHSLFEMEFPNSFKPYFESESDYLDWLETKDE